MRLILDNVSERDYEWLLSMAKALNFKVTAESSNPTINLEDVDSLLDNKVADKQIDDFTKSYGITEADVAEFSQRKAEYQSGEDTPIAWEAVKKRYGII